LCALAAHGSPGGVSNDLGHHALVVADGGRWLAALALEKAKLDEEPTRVGGPRQERAPCFVVVGSGWAGLGEALNPKP
jgi:hypothetical protein